MKTKYTLNQRVKMARDAAKLSQPELAKRVGIRQSTISELESGASQSTKYIVDIATACGVSVMWLAKEIGPMIPTSPDKRAG